MLRSQLSGAPLVAALMVPQCVVELLVVQAYAAAVIFVTAIAFVVASGGDAVVNPAALIMARGVDTLIGCAIGFLVLVISTKLRRAAFARDQRTRFLQSIRAVLTHVRSADVLSPSALLARQALQDIAFTVRTGNPQTHGRGSESRATEAAENLAYVVLGLAWLTQASMDKHAPCKTSALDAVDGMPNRILCDSDGPQPSSIDEQLDEAAGVLRRCFERS